MKPNFFKKSSILVSGLVAAAPIALAASCGGDSNDNQVIPNTVEVAVTPEKLETITINGDTKNISFVVPTGLTNVDANNTLSDSGTKVALRVLGRFNQPNFAGATTNLSFMPLPVLEYYLAGALTFTNNKLVANKDGQVIDIVAQHGGLFGFNSNNVAPTYMGVWDRNNLEFKLEARTGYSLPASMRDTAVKPKFTSDNFKSYVYLDFSQINVNNLANYYELTPDSLHNNLKWAKSLSLPPSWADFVKSVRFAPTSDTSIQLASTSLPTRVPYALTDRKLFVMFEPISPAYALPINPTDISSVLANVRTDVSDAPNYASNNLSTARLTIVNGDLSLVAPQNVTIPTGAKILYTIGENNTNAYDGPDLITALRGLGWSTDLIVYAFMAPTDLTKYEVTNNLRARITIDLGTFINTSSFFNNIASLKIEASSTPQNLVFNQTPSLPASLTTGVERIQYLIGSYATQAEAQAAPVASWVSTLPGAFVSGQTVSLWVRLIPKPGFTLSSAYADLTSSSNLRSIFPLVDTSIITDAIDFLYADDTSNHSNVVWKNVPSLDALHPSLVGRIARLEYLISNVNTIELATAASGWVTELPTTVSYDHTLRGLWFRLVAVPGYRLSNEYFNLTTSSRINNIRSKVDDSPLFAAIDLTKVKFVGSPSLFTIDTSAVTLPEGASIIYQIKARPYQTEGEFKLWLAQNVSTIVQADFATIKIKLGTSNANLYTLLNNKETQPDVSAFNVATLKTVSQVTLDALDNLQITTNTVSPDRVLWTTKPEATAPVARIEYLYGFYSTLSVALQAPAAEWGDLPTAVGVVPSQRFLWARLVPAPGETFGIDTYRDLTFSSNIRSVLYDATPLLESATAEARRELTFSATSVHSNVSWVYPVLDDTTAITAAFKVQYLYSEAVVSDTDLQSLSYEGWTDTLPSAIAYDASQRFVYVRVVTRPGYRVNSLAASLYDPARTIKSSADEEVDKLNLDLTVVKLLGSYANAVVDSLALPSLPAGIALYFRIGQSSWMLANAFADHMKTTIISLLDGDYLPTIRVRLQPFSALYVLNNSYEAAPNLTGFVAAKSVGVPQGLADAINAMSIGNDSTVSSIKWGSEPQFNLYEGISGLDYYVGTETAQNEITGGNIRWFYPRPLDVPIPLEQRNVWARVRAQVGYTVAETGRYFNITNSSGIGSLTINIAQELTALKTDFEGAGSYVPKATVTGTNVTWVVPTLPEGYGDKLTVSYFVSATMLADPSTAAYQSFLPSTVDSDPNRRFFYVSLRPKSGYSAPGTATLIFNLTALSNIKN